MLILIFTFYLALQETEMILNKKIDKKHIFIAQKHYFAVKIYCTLTMAFLMHLWTSEVEWDILKKIKPTMKQTQEKEFLILINTKD